MGLTAFWIKAKTKSFFGDQVNQSDIFAVFSFKIMSKSFFGDQAFQRFFAH